MLRQYETPSLRAATERDLAIRRYCGPPKAEGKAKGKATHSDVSHLLASTYTMPPNSYLPPQMKAGDARPQSHLCTRSPSDGGLLAVQRRIPEEGGLSHWKRFTPIGHVWSQGTVPIKRHKTKPTDEGKDASKHPTKSTVRLQCREDMLTYAASLTDVDGILKRAALAVGNASAAPAAAPATPVDRSFVVPVRQGGEPAASK